MKIFNFVLPVFLINYFQPISAFYLSRKNFIHNAGFIASSLSPKTGVYLEGSHPIENSKELATTEPSGSSDEYPLSLTFYSPITIESCVALTTYLKQLDIKSKKLQIEYGQTFPIKLHMQSGGGMLMPTFYVCDLIKQLDTPVHIYIDGFVASAASLISVCGSKRFMTKHSFMLIHQLQAESSGRLNEMKDEITNLDFFMDNAKDIYYKNSNISQTTLDNLLSNELWINAEQCLQLGLVDEII
uniref:Atp-Dependent Clp Protease, Proteolytic Subunit n=1 Tax=Florenciella sp. virus SA2 TaxID=3240092 RepID=A0AB39JDS2_9VIRU